jgi:uncharacterized surface protein with fasciclin (FAS1) repeats
MLNNLRQHAIASTLGLALVSTTLLPTISAWAQNTDTTPASSPTPNSNVSPKPEKMPPTEVKPTKKTTIKTTTTVKKVKKVPTIAALASKSKSLTTLVAALKAADLVDTLAGEGPYTVFAPTDAAFAKLPKKTLQDLLKPENKEKLQKILTYHVVAGKVMSKDIKPGKVETVEGSSIELSIKGTKRKRVMVNDAKVLTADIKASNGVVHLIDRVILPPDK